jgi:acetophenone carboxylase
MFAMAKGPIWRKRMLDLSRRSGPPHAPLFTPLLYAVAARIEAAPTSMMAVDATRIRKNVSELRRVLGTGTVVCAAPSGIEAEALGVPHDLSTWPPRPAGPLPAPMAAEPDLARLAASPRLAAALGAARQLQADRDEPLIVAGLTGPATLLAELQQAGAPLDDEAGLVFVGNALAAIARLYAEAGVHLLQLCEHAPPEEQRTDCWKGALGTIGNVARFHRVPPLLTVETGSGFEWPVQTVACPAAGQSVPTANTLGCAWPAQPNQWGTEQRDMAGLRVVTTVTDLPAHTDIAELRRVVSELVAG